MIFIITITGIVVAGFLAWIQFFWKKTTSRQTGLSRVLVEDRGLFK